MRSSATTSASSEVVLNYHQPIKSFEDIQESVSKREFWGATKMSQLCNRNTNRIYKSKVASQLLLLKIILNEIIQKTSTRRQESISIGQSVRISAA